jgi:hypothetical protein
MKIGDLIRWKKLKMRQYEHYYSKTKVGVVTMIGHDGTPDKVQQIYATCINGEKHQLCPFEDNIEVINENR